MKRHASSILIALATTLSFAADRTMVGSSGKVALDTTEGELSVDSGWHKDSSLGLRLSTVWDAASSGALSVNGTIVSTLGADFESDFGLILSANTACRYVCTWKVGEISYMRTIVTVGARQKGLSAGVSFDSRMGKRAVSSDCEYLHYDVAWYDNATTITMMDNGTAIGTGTSGMLLWTPTACSHTLTLKAMSSDGSQVGSESAIFTTAIVAHTPVNVDAVAATCTALGREAGTKCKICGAYLSGGEIIPALGHAEEIAQFAVAATCTTEGYTAEIKCSRCGVTLQNRDVVSALGHDLRTTIFAVSATCTTAGRTAEIKCSRCGLISQSSTTIAALGHSGVVTQPVVAPTSGASGRTAEIRCSRCNELIQTVTEIPALGYVRNVTARQLWPHKKVEVRYELAEDICEVADADGVIGLTNSAGHVARNVLGNRKCTPGIHRVVWDMEADGIEVKAADMTFSVVVDGDTPGFVTKTFTGSAFDKTSDVWGGTTVESPSGLYATSLAEHTTVAYGCYMRMEQGVTYYFKGCFDDYVAVKVNGNWIMGNSTECQAASGSFTPTASGYYPVEFRAGNNGGPGGCQNSNQYGIRWRTSVNTTWRNIGNTAGETVFFTGK